MKIARWYLLMKAQKQLEWVRGILPSVKTHNTPNFSWENITPFRLTFYSLVQLSREIQARFKSQNVLKVSIRRIFFLSIFHVKQDGQVEDWFLVLTNHGGRGSNIQLISILKWFLVKIMIFEWCDCVSDWLVFTSFFGQIMWCVIVVNYFRISALVFMQVWIFRMVPDIVIMLLKFL